MFNSMQLKQTLGKAGVLIIDDEADQASLNGYAYKIVNQKNGKMMNIQLHIVVS